MRARVDRSGSITVALPPDRALPLFTPEGERLWEEGWDPVYPAGGRPPAASGVVFTAGKDEGESTWVVARYDEDAGAATYAYVLPGHRAVLVDVRVEPEGEGSRVHVRYAATSLTEEGDAWVRAFDHGFDGFLAEWDRALAAIESSH